MNDQLTNAEPAAATTLRLAAEAWERFKVLSQYEFGREIAMADLDELLLGVEKTGPVSLVLDEVAAERRGQDASWGGPDHDDEHTVEDWCRLIEARSRMADSFGAPRQMVRKRLIQAAALAVAAVESLDRHTLAAAAVAAPMEAAS